MSFPVRFGKFLLLERVNVGGMAEVFKAKSTGVAGFERILAIKRILPNLVEDDDFIRMFIDEARIAVQLNHANIVQIYELGKQGEHYYIAMEYIPSRDLRGILDRLRASGQLMPIAQAAYITAKVAEGLDYAHRRKDPQGNPMNIIHRDVSPQNILVGFEGEVKVIDFGIAKAANRASKTQAGVLKGKFGYMSPEQVRGLPIDRRSDIFAVGVLLYEMLTGERLFIGESDFSTLERVRNADVIPPTSFNKKISPQLEQIVLKTLAREVEDRYQWATELARDLQSFSSDATGAYNARRVSGTMREMYAPEVALEKKKLEEFMRIVAADIKDKSSLPQSVLPLPARHDTNRDPVDDGDGEGEFGEDKTFVIEASAAGLALGAQQTDSNLANKQAARDINSDDVSLYGRGEGSDDDDDGDARTLVGAENPYFSSPGVPPVPLAKPEAPTRPMSPLQPENVARDAPEMPRQSVASPPRTAPRPGRSFDAVAAAMAQEDQDVLLAISGSTVDAPRHPPVPFGVEPAGAPREVTPSSATQPPPPPTQRPMAAVPRREPEVADDLPALLPSSLPAPVPWVPVGIAAAASAALLVAAVAFVAVRATGEGTPAELVLSAVGTPPAGLVISLDGQEVGRTLPLTVALPDGSHSLEVVAAGA
jgi:serine/threonine protein kinase